MNERIQKLYDQADKFAKENKTQTISGPGNNYFELFHEKFAELIVRECAKLNKKQSYELSGVIADTEKFGGFDLVCLDTVKRVEQYLASDTLINHFNKKD